MAKKKENKQFYTGAPHIQHKLNKEQDKLDTENEKNLQLFVAISPKIYQGVESVNHTFCQHY